MCLRYRNAILFMWSTFLTALASGCMTFYGHVAYLEPGGNGPQGQRITVQECASKSAPSYLEDSVLARIIEDAQKRYGVTTLRNVQIQMHSAPVKCLVLTADGE